MGAGATVAFGSHLPKRTGSVGQVQDGPWFPFSSGLALPSGAVSRSPCPELPSLWSARTLQQVESLLLPTVATPPSVRLLPSGPVSCAGLRPRSPGARKGQLPSSDALTRVCRSLEWLLKSKVESLDGPCGSLWGQKRALRALQTYLVPSSLATGDRIYLCEGMDS